MAATASIQDSQLNVIGTNYNNVVVIPHIVLSHAGLATQSLIQDGRLNVCGANFGPTISFIGLTTSALGPTGPHGTASISLIEDGQFNIIGQFDSVNLRTSIPTLTPPL